MKDFIGVVGIVVGFLIISVLIISIPFAIIWAGNHLFGLSIDYNIKSWLAVVIISLIIDGIRK